MTASRKNFHVAVVGAGIAGVTLAITLHHRNIPVTLYEQASAIGEMGAGVSFGPNAIAAMKVCHPGISEAFENICTRNMEPSKQNVWFDYLDGHSSMGTSTSAQNPGRQDIAFTISNSTGQTGVHRAQFLHELIRLVPDDIPRLKKRLDDVTEREDGKIVLKFADGSEDIADLVIGCDGIKSRVRQLMVGEDHPSANPSFTHKYIYRGLIPMDKAIEAVGEQLASNSCMHMGPGGHILTFPVDQGKTLNIVACHTTPDGWADYPRLTRKGTRDEVRRDFAGYGPNVINLLKLTDEELCVWAIFDLGEHPLSTFVKGRICLSGDAAHASSPHLGAGPGFCIEDTAVLAALLEDDRVHTHKDLQHVVNTFDFCRRERTQWLVQSSRFIADCYEWRAEGIERDFKKIEDAINHRNGIIVNVDIDKMCGDARRELAQRI